MWCFHVIMTLMNKILTLFINKQTFRFICFIAVKMPTIRSSTKNKYIPFHHPVLIQTARKTNRYFNEFIKAAERQIFTHFSPEILILARPQEVRTGYKNKLIQQACRNFGQAIFVCGEISTRFSDLQREMNLRTLKQLLFTMTRIYYVQSRLLRCKN